MNGRLGGTLKDQIGAQGHHDWLAAAHCLLVYHKCRPVVSDSKLDPVLLVCKLSKTLSVAVRASDLQEVHLIVSHMRGCGQPDEGMLLILPLLSELPAEVHLARLLSLRLKG